MILDNFWIIPCGAKRITYGVLKAACHLEAQVLLGLKTEALQGPLSGVFDLRTFQHIEPAEDALHVKLDCASHKWRCGGAKRLRGAGAKQR